MEEILLSISQCEPFMVSNGVLSFTVGFSDGRYIRDKERTLGRSGYPQRWEGRFTTCNLFLISFYYDICINYAVFLKYRWKEVLTTCTTGVVPMLQKLVEIMPDAVVVSAETFKTCNLYLRILRKRRNVWVSTEASVILS